MPATTRRPRFSVTPRRFWIVPVIILVLLGCAAGFYYMQRATRDGYDAGRRMHESATTGSYPQPSTHIQATFTSAPTEWDKAHAQAVRLMEPFRYEPFSEVASRYGDSGVGVAWLCTRTGMAMDQLSQQTIVDCFFWSLAGRMRSPHFPDFPDEATRRDAIRAGIDELIRRQGWSTAP